MEVHLVDGTYELFRHFYALPSAKDADGNEIAAVRGIFQSMLALTREGATHLGVATGHVIESFRNSLWPDYKSAAAVLSQFKHLEHIPQNPREWLGNVTNPTALAKTLDQDR